MRGELASEEAELSAPISRLLRGASDFLVAPLDLRLPMIYTGAVSINKHSVHDVTMFEAQQWQTLANAVAA